MKPYIHLRYDPNRNEWHLDAMDPNHAYLGIEGSYDSKEEAIKDCNEFFRRNGSDLRYQEEWIQLTLF